MIDEKQIAMFIAKLRDQVGERGNEVHHDVMQILESAIAGEDQYEDVTEIAKTLCEIVEPERLGELMCGFCHKPVPACGCVRPPVRVEVCICFDPSYDGHQPGCALYQWRDGA